MHPFQIPKSTSLEIEHVMDLVNEPLDATMSQCCPQVTIGDVIYSSCWIHLPTKVG